MLRCAQSSPENFTGSGADMSVLERQRAILQRLYHHPFEDQQQLLSYLVSGQSLINGYNTNSLHLEMPNWSVKTVDQSFEENSCSSLEVDHRSLSAVSNSASTKFKGQLTSSSAPKGERVATTKKRKAEFDEEDDCKEKRLEREATEAQSEITVKSEREASGNSSKENSKTSQVQKPDYIHVRARRGQATDSHSLAERARREKISKKMKCLQDLVPGCNKVIGKAGMLDEIINYVQSLQKQVEFLSMKLATLNPRLEFYPDNLLQKELPAYVASFPTSTPSELANWAYFQGNQVQQGVNECGADAAVTATQMMPQKAQSSSACIPEQYLDPSCVPQVQQLPTWETDWQNLLNPNFQ